jgi:hypothetical protein
MDQALQCQLLDDGAGIVDGDIAQFLVALVMGSISASQT